jgi:ABC-type glycerol-3-phosphate transport system substrate-binding protein
MTSFIANLFHPRRYALSLIAIMLIGLVACTSAPGGDTPRAPTFTPVAPAATLQPLPPTPVPDTPITLTLWLPTRFLPGEDNPAYQVLQRQLNEFARSVDGTPSRIAVKQDHGQGGLLDLLRTASPVAPTVLPDIIALDAADLETAARSGLVQPIGPLLPADAIDDLYPFARDLGSINGELYGVLYHADVEHLATGTTTPLPARWSDLIENPRRYVFALGNASGGISDAVLAHYLSEGGTLVDAQGNPALDERALRALLETYLEARDAGILAGNFTDLDNADAVWNTWRGVGTAVANVDATHYLSVEARLPNLQVGDLPTLVLPADPIGRGWMYAMVTQDPRRQAAAVRLLQHLLSPQNSGEWTRAAKVLPGQAVALAQWDQADPYVVFIRNQLAHAQSAPPASHMTVIGPALRQAVEDVLAGQVTPAEAARIAMLTVNPGEP